MGKAAAGAPLPVEAVHSRRPTMGRFLALVSWRLCAAGQVGPVVHRGAGKARRILNRDCQGKSLLFHGGAWHSGDVPAVHGWGQFGLSTAGFSGSR